MAVNIGDRYNKWTVIGKAERNRYYICQCDCGYVKEVQDYSLTSGKSKSCGKCNQVTVNIGDTFGDWTVIEVLDKYKARCRCSCSKVKDINIYTLKNGSSTNCGHLKNLDRVIDLRNKLFGELTPIEYLGNQA